MAGGYFQGRFSLRDRQYCFMQRQWLHITGDTCTCMLSARDIAMIVSYLSHQWKRLTETARKMELGLNFSCFSVQILELLTFTSVNDSLLFWWHCYIIIWYIYMRTWIVNETWDKHPGTYMCNFMSAVTISLVINLDPCLNTRAEPYF